MKGETESVITDIALGDMMHVYGGFGCGVDYTVRLSVRLTEDIDRRLLEAALERTQARFPYFCVRMTKRGESFVYEPNSLPVPLLRGSERTTLGCAETNGHVWAVSCEGDTLRLDFYHGITDGAGMYAVLAALLQYYCEAKYGDTTASGPELLASAPEPSEYADPLESLTPTEPEPISLAEAFTFETDGMLSPATPTVWDIELPEDAFIAFISAHDSSPGTMVSLLLAQAIASLYPERRKDIVGAYVINARPMLGSESVMHNCLSMAIFKYGARMERLPFEAQCTAYRGMTFLQSDELAVRAAMAANAGALQAALREARTLEARKRVFAGMFAAGEGKLTYLVSYVGKWKYASTGGRIRELWCHPPNTFGLMAELGAAGGKLFVSIQQRFGGDAVVRAFLDRLGANSVPYEIKRKAPADNAFMPEPK